MVNILQYMHMLYSNVRMYVHIYCDMGRERDYHINPRHYNNLYYMFKVRDSGETLLNLKQTIYTYICMHTTAL